MLIVKAYVGPKFNGPIVDLRISCEEIIPFVMNSPQGPITMGSIEFIYQTTGTENLKVDVLLDIEAGYSKDRELNLKKRAKAIENALAELFPNNKYAIWLKLVKAEYSSNIPDQKSNRIKWAGGGILSKIEKLKITLE